MSSLEAGYSTPRNSRAEDCDSLLLGLFGRSDPEVILEELGEFVGLVYAVFRQGRVAGNARRWSP